MNRKRSKTMQDGRRNDHGDHITRHQKRNEFTAETSSYGNKVQNLKGYSGHQPYSSTVFGTLATKKVDNTFLVGEICRPGGG